MKFVEPKTFLVGVTGILDGLKEYLEYSGNEEFLETLLQAKQEGLSDGEILCSFYAKLCYKSLTLGKNANVKKIRDIEDNLIGCFDSGHGCYDEQTEVLTKDGWKFWEDVVESDLFATLDKDGEFEWQKASKLYKSEYNGDMIEYNSNHVDLLVTTNHNMLACKTTTKNGRKKEFSSYSLYKAKELNNCSHSLLKSCPYYDNTDLIKDYQLLGFAIGDGYINGNKIEFHLKKERKITYLKSIAVVEEKDNDKYIVNIPLCLEEVFKSIYNKNKEKVIPKTILDNNYILYSVYDGLINSDGCIQESGISYDTTSYELAGQIQLLCCLIGYSANISQAECYKNRKNSYGNKPIYRLSIVTRSNKPDFNKSLNDIYQKTNIINYKGNIYCCEVPNHTLYVRRNGKPVWCGNSVFEHCNLNFITTDCSRVFTHELVRHRVGTAFSQTSGRYVALTDIDFVTDPILKPVEEDIREIVEFIEKKAVEIREKLDVDNQDFTLKKKLTSAIRRIAPNGQANEIGFSMNIRSLRHILVLRTSPHAEWEIRLIFNQIGDIIESKWPLMLYGLNKVDTKDGLFSWDIIR